MRSCRIGGCGECHFLELADPKQPSTYINTTFFSLGTNTRGRTIAYFLADLKKKNKVPTISWPSPLLYSTLRLAAPPIQRGRTITFFSRSSDTSFQLNISNCVSYVLFGPGFHECDRPVASGRGGSSICYTSSWYSVLLLQFLCCKKESSWFDCPFFPTRVLQGDFLIVVAEGRGEGTHLLFPSLLCFALLRLCHFGKRCGQPYLALEKGRVLCLVCVDGLIDRWVVRGGD